MQLHLKLQKLKECCYHYQYLNDRIELCYHSEN
jgi:hypothetical protein